MTKNELLEQLLTGKEVKLYGFTAKWTKNEYSVLDWYDQKVFSRIPNYFSFVELCDFLDVRK